MQGLKKHKPRVLVIDDNPSIHDDFQKILAANGDGDGLKDAAAAFFGDVEDTEPQLEIELESAHQGQQGLEKVAAAVGENRSYALAFVDMRMPPGWDGLTTIEHLWNADPDLQIVICSAYSDNSWLDIRQRFGCTDRLLVLKKPFDSIEVLQLASTLTTKRILTHQAKLKMDELERLVKERTKDLRHEIEQRKRVEEELIAARDDLAYQATHDPVTGLWNRRAIFEFLERCVGPGTRRTAPLGVGFVDADYFKKINDSYGHIAGDTVLRGLAGRMQAILQDIGEVGRCGGEEFIVVLPDCTPTDCVEIAEQLREAVEREPFATDAGEISTTVSIGLAVIDPDEDTTINTLVSHADDALYDAKTNGRNRVVPWSGETCDRKPRPVAVRNMVTSTPLGRCEPNSMITDQH